MMWCGVRVVKNPLDLWIYHEIIYETKPDIIIETGTYQGGSALYFAHLFDIIGKGKIITVDIDKYENLPVHPRIEYITGSCLDSNVIELIKGKINNNQSVMVILDSCHNKEHVSKELEIYPQFVTKDSYLIVEDTNTAGNPISLKNDGGPYQAVKEFLRKNRDFVIDKQCERFRVTWNPSGFLKRVQ